VFALGGAWQNLPEIAEILGLAFGSVKTHLDAARHKLHCMNLTHAAAVAFATGSFRRRR